MLPSLLASDIRTGLKQFLVNALEPSDAFMHGLMSRFVATEASWLKGPYVQVGLPFVAGTAGRKFFSTFETEYPGFSHQEQAWQRLSTSHTAANTLVATGTGSGKTECFLYPVLDHCARAKANGEAGIKTLVIYPMNALATDQARRIADLIAKEPAFRGLRVGLYVGGDAGQPGQGAVMTQTSVITDRNTLCKNPPDILLTNYKMLDYLMLRPKDRALWAQNKPETLRYVVVDELHTFDGAQGTDLALLLRRLRARLKVPEGQLICAGTSATLGGSSDTTPLREYARQIFASPFPPESVITENRQSVEAFLENAMVNYMFIDRAEHAAVIDPVVYESPEHAVAAWYQLFFPELPVPADVTDKAWRIALGVELKQHQLFVNLLKLVKGGVVSYAHLCDAFARSMPSASKEHVARVMDALLVLVAWAMRSYGQPLVTLRVQLWIREMRRMVGKVAVHPDDVNLVSERDLPGQRDGVYLPMIQCTQCRTTGWLSRLVPGSSKLSTSLDEIYNTWFSSRPEASRLYPASALGRSYVDGIVEQACTMCGNTQQGKEACQACGHQELLPVFRVVAQRTSVVGQLQIRRHDPTCPACGEKDLILLGARNATIGAQVVELSWASVFNDDKKLIAFSDSVQDAAHRAGFFGARTYQNNVRTALAHVMDELGQHSMPWNDFILGIENQFGNPASILHMEPERLVSEFLAPNMTWLPDWSEELLKKGHQGRLPAGSRLPEKVKKRLLWQAFSELTYTSQRGRSLERIGKAVLYVPWERVHAAAERVLPAYRETFGAQGLDLQTTAVWLLGALTHMRRRGGVVHPELATYAADGELFPLSRYGGRGDWFPNLGTRTPHPVFITLGKHREFDRLVNSGNARQTWYEQWANAVLGQQILLAKGMAAEMYLKVFEVLVQDGVLVRSTHTYGDTLGLNPESLRLSTDVAFVATRGGKRRLAVHRNDAEHLLGLTCLDAIDTRYEEIVPQAVDWWAQRFSRGHVRRVIAAEHTGLLERPEREALEIRFKDKSPKPWFENLLSATPTLEMGVDIGNLSSVLLCSVPPNQASFLQRVGRAGRRDGNAVTTTLADGNSPHDQYFFAETQEMMAGEVSPPGIFLQAAEVLRRQLFAFCMDDWVATLTNDKALPEKTSQALDVIEQAKEDRFPYIFSNYVLAHESRLFDGFVALLGKDIDDIVKARLLEYMQGQGEVDGLRAKLMKTFEELLDERKTYRKRKDELEKTKARVQQGPQDDATRDEIENLSRERDKQLEMIKEINSRDLLNTLTDAGLIPNYAFPEAGVELKSVLWRKRGADEPGKGAYITLDTLKYERPAQSALSEFAPENRFYANQRRVEIDQINMSLAKAEDWRFCPSCHHMQNLAKEPDIHPSCPHCNDPMWGDAAQKRKLLRFKQAIANSDDTKVRIDDSVEDREPKYYVRQLMADFSPDYIREAWQLKSSALPFGFEFISRVTFRDVNFGELAKQGEEFKVADKEMSRPGFKLCRHCGKVQKQPKRNADSAQQLHSYDCVKHGNNEPDNLLECLYLYREFDSEALRILVPYTRNGVDERVIQSFMAAVQLGLKKRFGGKVDHLRMVMQDVPGKDGGPRKHYVMLYDSVPGGTGYLHQLLAQEAGTLQDVLKMALKCLSDCSCNQDPEKDGCYRCLYQYRLGRSMEQTSRDMAKSVLTELVASLDQMERVATISEIYINPNFDSVLEARFIQSLKRLNSIGGLPIIKLNQDIVNGKSGFLLEVGNQRYRIEPQVEMNDSKGVKVFSKPDFVIWPWATGAKRKPVAIFCDGWTHHKNSLKEDAQKRSAIVATGRFWVWSVTHNDVMAALDGKLDTDLDSALMMLARHSGDDALATIPRAQSQAFNRHAVARLLSFLATSEVELIDPAVEALQRDALWLGFLMVPHNTAEQGKAEQQRTAWKSRLPTHLQVQPAGFAPSQSKEGGLCRVIASWPMVAANGDLSVPWTAPGVLMLDDLAAEDEATLHTAWRQWLALYNTQQVLPGMLMTTSSGLDARDYEALDTNATSVTSVPPAMPAEIQAVWESVLSQVFGPLQAGLRVLATASAPPPEVGMELDDARGQVVAESELVWADARVVVLRADQEDFQTAWSGAGWTVILLKEEQQRAGEAAWTEPVALALGLKLN